MTTAPLSLSVVVVAYDMAREVPRTLQSLAPGYQRGIDAADYEVIVVDNGSPEPLDADMLAAFPGRLRSTRIDPAPPTPAGAANRGIEMADSDYVGLLIDGARLASPGLLSRARLGRTLADRTIVATLAWHLGTTRHMGADEAGYDQDAEDELLAASGWEQDGYRLFSISTLAASSARGWFAPMGESNGLFMARSLWQELGGLDEHFALPGGGLSNHDLYRRACELDDVQLVVLLGEGTFHQIHGGAATSGRIGWDEMHDEYVKLRGRAYEPPTKERMYLGTVPDTALPYIEHSAARAMELRKLRPPSAEPR
jgi:glycosyltransferase involved in cell wall biosynthesis